MDKKSATVEDSRVSDPVGAMREQLESSLGPGREAKDMSMPVCFLVKEQAKSLVAIQELQKRMENVEFVQEDVIESLVEIRNFLCGERRSISALSPATPSLTKSPAVLSLKSSPFTKSRRFSYSPSVIKSTLETSRLKSASSRDCDPLVSELKKPLPSVAIHEHSQKFYDLQKNKESVLESDKQDSGLDSDCREPADGHPSLSKHWAKQESNDELLQLLDEISERSEILQKQLSAVEENVGLQEVKPEMSSAQAEPHYGVPLTGADEFKSKQSFLESASNTLECENKDLNQKVLPSSPEQNGDIKRTVPTAVKKRPPGFDTSVCFEKKSLSDRVSKIRKRAANRIDSAMVSSVLKETNVVELQRQVLIYLVENAVLQTKLSEAEQSLQAKTLQSEKVENSLKDESRMLMMENRELRIGLDEQKFEVKSLKSKVAMLERVLQSVTVENRELNWQLGESLGLQNMSRKDLHNLSPSFTLSNTDGATPKHVRRSSLPHQFSSQSERSVTGLKSKLHPNSSVFLDVTAEEPDSNWQQAKYKAGPAFSSTPHGKLKDGRKTLSGCPSITVSGDQSPNFQTVKNHLKCNGDKDSPVSQNIKCLEETLRCHSELTDETGAAKFPFSTIIEKLKANSDYRLSRRTSVSATELSGNIAADAVAQVKTRAMSAQDRDMDSARNAVDSRRKGKNIHQRIQDILDRIMAESEDAT